MFLLKCKCGCIFTLKNDLERRRYNTKCPDCSKAIRFNSSTSIADSLELDNEIESIRYIPDDAKITVTFDT